MKPEIHPDYHDVIFVDSATGTEWTSRSTVTSAETREIEGIEVPVVRLEISAASHPFWTGTKRELDADGKIDRFRKRYGGSKPGSAAAASPPADEAPADAAPADAEATETAPSEEATEETAAQEASADTSDTSDTSDTTSTSKSETDAADKDA